MEPQEIIDLGRNAIKTCLIVGGPILLASLVVGMVIGAVQAMTQVPDQSVSFVPKLICLILVVGLALPWLTEQMLDYSREAFATPISIRPVSNGVTSVNHTRPADQIRSLQNQDEEFQHPPSRSIDDAPGKPPFHLPSYRYSRLPKENIEG